jgi:flagellar secretion chaperone FliS
MLHAQPAAYPSQHAAYQSVHTTTAEPDRIILLLFDGAARFLRQAQQGLDRGGIDAFAYPLSRAHAIIAELSSSLDREQGGEVAAHIGSLYEFMLRHLTEGLVAKSRTHLTEVLHVLQELRDGFEQAAQAVRHELA